VLKRILHVIISFIFCGYFSYDVFAQNLAIYCEDDNPLQFYDHAGNLTGLTVELVREIQKRVGNRDAIQVVPWARGLDKLNNNPNVLLFSMARTPERDTLYQWIGPITAITYSLYVKAESLIKIESLEDAKKMKLIGVYRDDIRDQTLTRLGFGNLDRASSNVSSFKKLMMGRVSAYADSKMGVENLARAAGFQVSDVKPAFELFKSQLYIAASKNTDPAIVVKWNTALEAMKSDKTFSILQRKYLPEIEQASTKKKR
jgi:polar amino acid transport system substrate-binding protein